MFNEGIKVNTRTILWKIRGAGNDIYEYLRNGGSIDELIKNKIEVDKKEIHGNILLTEGANYIWRMISGETGLTPFDGNNSYIGVGNGSTPASPGQVGLQGTLKYYKKVDSGYPVITGNKIIFRATFSESEANFRWMEWTVANGGSDTAINLNRKVEDLGVKTDTMIWVLQVELTLS